LIHYPPERIKGACASRSRGFAETENMKIIAGFVSPIVLLSSSLFAQDMVGRWAGVAESTDEAGTKRQERQTFEIRSEGGKLTSQQIGRDGKPVRTLEVQQDGGRVNLYVYLELDGGEPLRWKLELKDGKLVGTFSAQHHNPAKWQYDRIGAVTFTKGEPGVAAGTKPYLSRPAIQ
jgi:hypothetical protein